MGEWLELGDKGYVGGETKQAWKDPSLEAGSRGELAETEPELSPSYWGRGRTQVETDTPTLPKSRSLQEGGSVGLLTWHRVDWVSGGWQNTRTHAGVL